MGGGTGTGAAPVIAETARRMGILTVGVVTKPFLFEGTRRMRAAEAGISDLQEHVDTLIVIPNQNLFLIASQDTTFKQAFEMADEVLQQGVRSITDLMVMPGLINLDFADVRSVMSEMGKAMMGTGEAEGENRAKEAAEQAIANPLLDGVSMQGAKGVIISIIGGEDMKLFEVDGAANHIRNLVDEDANIIWGSAFNPNLDGKIRVSVVATGIEQDAQGATPSPASVAAPGSLTPSRAPQRPVLDLDGEAEMAGEEAGTPDPAPAISAGRERSPLNLSPPEPTAYEPPVEEDEPEAESSPHTGALFSDPVAEAQEAEDEDFAEEARPFDLTGMQAGDDMGEPEDDDVDEIIDPLAGLRGAEEEPFDLSGSEAFDEDHSDAVYSEIDDDDDEGGENDDYGAARQPQGRAPAAEGTSVSGQSSPAAPATPRPAGSSGEASTLFERMANLSRSSSVEEEDDDEDDDDGAPALSIPRFLGRQNNQ
jgi:cell division protein FtsZ